MSPFRNEVLIVEDEMLVADDLEESLQELGYGVAGYARDVDEAMQKVEETKPDLILMDIKLGAKGDGIAAGNAIRERWGLPIVFVTAYTSPEIVERVKESSPYGFLIKPVGLAELDATLCIAMNQHQSTQRELNQREELQHQVNETSVALENTRLELQALSHRLISLQDDERRRIARELHDDLGQLAAFLLMKLDGLGAKVSGELAEDVRSLRLSTEQIARGLREVSHRLHPSIIEDLGIDAALRAFIEEMLATGLRITGRIDPCPPVSKEAGTALYRIAQEAIQNSRKYGAGSPITVRLWCDAGYVYLSVQDDGPGFLLSEVRGQGGLGLVSMQERARLVGGTLLLNTAPGNGTRVGVRIPLQRQET